MADRAKFSAIVTRINNQVRLAFSLVFSFMLHRDCNTRHMRRSRAEKFIGVYLSGGMGVCFYICRVGCAVVGFLSVPNSFAVTSGEVFSAPLGGGGSVATWVPELRDGGRRTDPRHFPGFHSYFSRNCHTFRVLMNLRNASLHVVNI